MRIHRGGTQRFNLIDVTLFTDTRQVSRNALHFRLPRHISGGVTATKHPFHHGRDDEECTLCEGGHECKSLMVVTQPPGAGNQPCFETFWLGGHSIRHRTAAQLPFVRSLVALFPMSIASKVCVLLVLLGLMASLAGGGASASPAASTMPSLGHKVRAAPRWTGAQYGRLTGCPPLFTRESKRA